MAATTKKNNKKKPTNSTKVTVPVEQHSKTLIWKEKIKRNLTPILAVLAGLAILVLAMQYIDARREVDRLSESKNTNQTGNDDLVKEVERILIVPKGEQPTIADVSDKEQLKDKAFFAAAENGDKVLIYQKASLAIIYRPSTKQIVNVAMIDPQNAAPASQATTPNPTPAQ